MSTRYVITPYDPQLWEDEKSPGGMSSLVINFRDFSRAAQAKWSTYKNYPYFSWEISFNDGTVLSGGFTGPNHQILAIEKPYAHFGEFVAWYRTYISASYKLFLFVEGSWSSLELSGGITEADISQFTGLS